MTNKILEYYNQELDYVRLAGAEFAKRHPKIASNLRLDQNSYRDPLVERLIESFAFLTAKMSRQLDGDYMELAQSVLAIVYPTSLLPIPALSTVQFTVANNISVMQQIERHTQIDMLSQSDAIGHFRTCYPLQLWPLAALDIRLCRSVDLNLEHKFIGLSKGCIRVSLATTNDVYQLASDPPDTLRFYINAQKQYVNKLYEYILNHVQSIVVCGKNTKKQIKLCGNVIRPVGFSQEDCLLPAAKQSMSGFSLLCEYSFFQDKFMYFDVCGLKEALVELQENEVELLFFVDDFRNELIAAFNKQVFLLGCTPIVNLFEQKSEPLRVNHQHSSYHLSIDSNTEKEVFSVNALNGWNEAGAELKFKSLYGLKYGESIADDYITWEAIRKPTWHFMHADQNGDEIMLRFMRQAIRAIDESAWTVEADLLCMNRNVPSNSSELLFRVSDMSLDSFTISCLRQPTRVVRPNINHKNIGHLLSTIAATHDSLMDVQTNLESFKRILLTANVGLSSELNFLIGKVCAIHPKQCCARYPYSEILTYVQGVNLNIEFDMMEQADSELFLFGSVLNHFLNQFCPLNSFISLTFSITNKGEIAKWKPQFGRLPI